MTSSIFDFLNVYSLLACAIALFWYYGQSSYNFWSKLRVKFLKPTPFLGNIAPFVLQQKPLHETLDRLYNALQDEPYIGIYEMRNPTLLVKDPQLVSTILVTHFKNFHDRIRPFSLDRNRKLNPLFQHFFVAEGERWRILRQKIRPFFSPAKLKHMYEQISHCVCLMTECIDSQMNEAGSVDANAKQIFERLTIDVIGTCAFGIDCNSLKSNDKLAQMCREIFKPSFATVVRLLASSFGDRLLTLLNLPNVKKEVSDFFLKLALDTVEYRRSNGVERNDLLQVLMNMQNSHEDPKFAVGGSTNVLENEEFDEIDIAANTSLFFFAGYETTSATLSFCIYELALNEDIQQRLLSEVQQVQDKYKTINYDSLKEMHYMNAVIAETLRKYPSGVTLNRKCTEDYVIPESKVQVPAGTKIVVPVWSIHHDSKYYPNPEIFDPQRFINDHEQFRPGGVYFPFGDGPRFCIGKHFAEIEIKAALSKMILKYEIKPCAETEIPLTYKGGTVFLNTKRGIWINLTRRQSTQ